VGEDFEPLDANRVRGVIYVRFQSNKTLVTSRMPD
jgi:hypothetical protein